MFKGLPIVSLRPNEGRFQLHLGLNHKGKLDRAERSGAKQSTLFKRLLRPPPRRGPRNDPGVSGQAMIEFSFCVILVIILFLGLIKVFVWTGRDLVERRRTHERVLKELSSGGREQVRPVFFYSARFNAAIDSNLFGM